MSTSCGKSLKLQPWAKGCAAADWLATGAHMKGILIKIASKRALPSDISGGVGGGGNEVAMRCQ